MNHKEEAIKRVEEFRPHAKYWDCYHDVPLNENHDKQCALLAIEREIKLLQKLLMFINNIDNINAICNEVLELKKVKKEIELL